MGMPPVRLPPIGTPPPVLVPPERRTKEEASPRPCKVATVSPELQQLAEASGGGYFQLKQTDDLASTFVRVVQELRQQYVMAFPIAVRDGKVHDLEVRVKDRDVKVRARRGYVSPPS